MSENRGDAREVQPQHARKMLVELISKGTLYLKEKPISLPQKAKWEGLVQGYLTDIYGENSQNLAKVLDVGKVRYALSGGEKGLEDHRATTMEKQIAIIDGYREAVESRINFEGN